MTRRIVPALIGGALLAGCGGGGGASPSVTPSTSAVIVGSTGGRTPVATATLTIKFSPGFHTATMSGARTSATSRKPAYVNSLTRNFLQVWVVSGGTATHVVNTSIAATTSGAQTVSVPLYSTLQNQIVAYEADIPYGQTFGSLLAIGETDVNTVTAGSAPQVALTMFMNARYPGVMSDPNDANNDAAIVSNPYSAYPQTCIAGSSSGPLYFFATDPDGGFIDAAGAGGVSLPTLTGWTSDVSSPQNVLSQGAGVTGAYNVTFNNLSGGLTAKLLGPNPAYAIAYDAVNALGTYPGVDFLYPNVDPYLGNAAFLLGNVVALGPTFSGNLDVSPNTGSCPGGILINGTFTAYNVTTPGSGAAGIAVGSDNALWFTENYINKIGRVTTGGVFTEYGGLAGTAPTGIIGGSDGNLWFTESAGNNIGRITTAGSVTEYTVPTSSSLPLFIAAGSDNALWFTENNANKIGRITTAAAFSEYTILTASSGPLGITAGSDGALWFTEQSANKIGRITTGGVITEYTIPTGSSGPTSITSGPDGALWFTENFAGKIGRVTTGGVFTEYTLSGGADPGYIASGPANAVFFTEQGLNRIGSITTSGAYVELAVPNAPAGGPSGIVQGPDSAMWFPEQNSPAKIVRLH